MSPGITINGIPIERGKKDVVSLHVGRLPSGAKISVKTHIYCGVSEGPTLLLVAGLHGDEINGVEILRRAISFGIFDNLERGNLLVIPILNIYGFVNFSRMVPDGKDVNRSFPGRSQGSLASRMAHLLSRKVLPIVDVGVDFHTGGDNRFNFPQVRFSRKDEKGFQMAKAFGAPFLVQKPALPNSFRSIAREMGKSMIIYEGGESLRLDGHAIETALKGIRRLLISLSMVPGTLSDRPVITFRKSSWIRASQSGIFIWSKASGQKVKKGEPLGSIYDPYGLERIVVLASRDGFILGHNNTPVVHQGDALFHLGYEYE